MAKLILLFATFAFFALLANASVYRTIVGLDEDDDNQWGPQGRCRREFQQQQHLRACQRFMRRQAQRWGRPGEDLELDLDEDENQRQPILRQCCNELRQVDRQCICPVLRQAAHQQRIQGQIEGPQQVRRLFRTARNLPNMCNIPVGTCPFTARPYDY